VSRLMFLCLTLASISISYASGKTCQERYNSAVIACKNLSGICMNVSICKDIRSKCPQNIGDMASCEEFKQCTRKNTPPIFNTVCLYNWQGHPTNGSCYNTNGMRERVANTCPGNSATLAFADYKFNCMGQVKNFQASKKYCEDTVKYYNFACETTPDRPSIAIKTCPEASVQLATSNDTVTAEAKVGVNISRNLAKKSQKWTMQDKLRSTNSQSNSSVITP